jgi:hypothetical protein
MKFKVVQTRANPRWKVPVWIRIKTGRLEAIRGPEEALERLAGRWPRPHARHYRSAITNCEAAVSGQFSAELAREAFVRASLEAAMLVDGFEKRAPKHKNTANHATSSSVSTFLTA